MKRIIGLDLGSKTLGVAISDPLKITAQGLTTINFNENSYKMALQLLAKALQEYEIELFVLGNPKHMNGDLGDSSQRSIAFKKRLENYFKVDVILWDERLTSVLMEKSMISMNLSRQKRKKTIDKMAAINILQGYLDAKS
ncbi:Holliday junction resolvase RuvX [Erysipelotrichaceae bacterium OttesenSCG-928-M19]|nr:Holliday junction resolvase RuvX [Erysipelotrichaceae bacterium OttesenSCG-928-M19]